MKPNISSILRFLKPQHRASNIEFFLVSLLLTDYNNYVKALLVFICLFSNNYNVKCRRL